MKISISKSKNTEIFYLSKSVWVNGKSTTRTVEKIGTLEEVKKLAGDMDPYTWAKQYAARRTQEEKQAQKDILVKYSPSTLIRKDERRRVNVGYLFLQQIYHELGLSQVCRRISKEHKFSYDLDAVLSRLVYSRIIYPASKLATYDLAKRFLEPAPFELQHIYRALGVLAKENDRIQASLYENSLRSIKRKKGVLFYDCTNYYFEIDDEDLFRKYGCSKEHRPNPIVQMGLFMDADGIPLAFSLFDGSSSEQLSLKPLEQKILTDFGVDEFIVCTDAGLSSDANRRFNAIQGRGFITTQSVKKLKGHLKDFCLDPEGWKTPGSSKTFNLDDLDEETDKEKVFFKERWINEEGLEQHLIVTFSLKRRAYQRWVRNRQIERAKAAVDSSRPLYSGQNNYKRFIGADHSTPDGEAASRTVRYLDKERIMEEERYDGFYAVCTNLDDAPSEIIAVNQKRWQIEECFRIMKSEFLARPVYLSRQDRITAHFLTCFIALVVYRILERKLDHAFTCEELIDTLRDMEMLVSGTEGYIPVYMRTDTTDALHEVYGFRTDYQIIPSKEMKKICTGTTKKKI